jgi:predicted Zn-dependent protease
LGYSLDRGKPFSQKPWSMRVEPVPGTRTLTIDEMIANCQRGIYINRFSDVSSLDPSTGMQTGVTRDGCFLIQNGKIDRPVKNFRFVDSPLFMFNRIEAIGIAERAVIGFVPVDYHEPQYPMVVPPMMIRDFNFTALSGAV